MGDPKKDEVWALTDEVQELFGEHVDPEIAREARSRAALKAEAHARALKVRRPPAAAGYGACLPSGSRFPPPPTAAPAARACACLLTRFRSALGRGRPRAPSGRCGRLSSVPPIVAACVPRR